LSELIKISDRPVVFPRSIASPKFGAKRVISSSPWEYVDLWLRKNSNSEAQIFWEQARQFYSSAMQLPVQSAPLPLYYSFLNAVKALLTANSIPHMAYHGVTGFDARTSAKAHISLESEGIKLKNGGVLPGLISYLQETSTNNIYSLEETLANLAFVHRAYAMSYNCSEMFLSIIDPRYVKSGNNQARFEATLPEEHTHGQTIATIPNSFKIRNPTQEEQDRYGDQCKIIESSGTFGWTGARRPSGADLSNLAQFHRNLRVDLAYISGTRPYWYLKRNLQHSKLVRVDRNSLTLLVMAMHRMSEISRYKPVEMNKLFQGKRNWLLHEFIRSAATQFMDEIASEITGNEISPAGVQRGVFLG